MENPASSPNQVALGVQPEITNTPKEKNLKTPQKQREQALAYYYANREAIRNRYNNYSDEKREIRRARARKWRATNKPAKAKYDKNWRETNREQWLALAKRQRQKPKARMISSLRRRLRDFIQEKSHRKSLDFGCTRKQLREHIEKQFQNGMSWLNYGEWHVDHIVPCKMFNLYLENHQKFCFNWRNLRPLPGEENVRKRAKFESSHLALLDKEFISELTQAGILQIENQNSLWEKSNH
jgi:hypothetical protein